MVPVNKIEHGIASYLDAELMPQFAGNGIEKLIAGTAASLIIRKSGAIIGAYKDNPMVKTLGIMDDKGNVDIDTISEELKKNITKEGVKVPIPVIGTLTFHRDDVDKLYNYIMD